LSLTSQRRVPRLRRRSTRTRGGFLLDELRAVG